MTRKTPTFLVYFPNRLKLVNLILEIYLLCTWVELMAPWEKNYSKLWEPITIVKPMKNSVENG